MLGKIHTPREKRKTPVELHVTGLCFREDPDGEHRIQIQARSLDRELYPGLLETCGGQVSGEETFVDAVRRHFLGELGLEVRVRHVIGTYMIKRPSQENIYGVSFFCEFLAEVAPPDPSKEIFWLTLEEIVETKRDFYIPGLKSLIIRNFPEHKNWKQHVEDFFQLDPEENTASEKKAFQLSNKQDPYEGFGK